jgi:23S rRNA pseudoU1915 N3-methylase RlmH
MRYPLRSRKPNTLKLKVEELRKETKELIKESAEALVQELGKEKRQGKQKARNLKHNELEAIQQEIRANQKRLKELTGQSDKVPPNNARFPFDFYRPPAEKKSNERIVVFQGGAPGLGKRS